MWIDDQILKQCETKETLQLWIPKDIKVVLGSANKQETECIETQCRKDSVPVLRRYGGGGTVVLHPGCVIISYGTWVKHQFKNDYYFDKINQAVIKTLSKDFSSLSGLSQAGISDIAFQNKKICGTSMFRSRNYLLYQASILVEKNIELIERYLNHPDKEPDYREGKSHRDFLTSLNEIDSSISSKKILEVLKNNFSNEINTLLGEEIEDPHTDQVKYILKRALKEEGLKAK